PTSDPFILTTLSSGGSAISGILRCVAPVAAIGAAARQGADEVQELKTLAGHRAVMAPGVVPGRDPVGQRQPEQDENEAKDDEPDLEEPGIGGSGDPMPDVRPDRDPER